MTFNIVFDVELFGGAAGQRIVLTLFHFLWQALLIGGLSLAATTVVRKSAIRYNIGVLGLTLMAVLPVATLVWLSTENATLRDRGTQNATARASQGQNAPAQINLAPTPNESGVAAVADRKQASSNFGLSILSSSSPLVLTGYGIGVALMLLRLLTGFVGGIRLKRSATAIGPCALTEFLEELARRWRMTAVPALRTSEKIAMPVVVGIMKPAILIPASMMSSFSQVHLEAILSHELAHVRRFDLLVNILQRLVETVLFFHPVVWLLSRQISAERERCCDDLAVDSGCDSLTYADTLVRVAESCQSDDRQRFLTALASTGTSRSELKRRVLRLIDPDSVAAAERTGGGAALCLSGLIAAALFAATLFDLSTANAEPQDDNKPAATSDVTEPLNDEIRTRIASITISGRAVSRDGQVVADARIFVASVRDPQKLLKETKTDENGRYLFTDVQLPIQHDDRAGGKDRGVFEVFGMADGYGFAWCSQEWYYPDGNPNSNTSKRTIAFQPGVPIVQDLEFFRAARFSGRVVDGQGKPIARTTLALRKAEYAPIGGIPTSDPTVWMASRDFAILYHSSVTPPELRETVTNDDGYFWFDHLPEDTRFRIEVRPPGYAKRKIFTATLPAEQIQPDENLEPDGTTLVFESLQSVPISVVYDDTGLPAKNVFVSLNNDDTSHWKVTDTLGNVELKVPRGEYKLSYLVEFGTPYISRHSRGAILEHTVGSTDNQRKPAQIRLELAATVEIEVVDAETGEPLEGVDIWCDPKGQHDGYAWRTWKPPRFSMGGRRQTNPSGKLTMLFMPGEYTIHPGDDYRPRGYGNANTVKKSLVAGNTYSVKLTMERLKE